MPDRFLKPVRCYTKTTMNSIILRISIRNLLKNKFTSLICVLGLSLGFIAYILITLFIRYEMSWDRENEHFNRIYLVQRNIALSAQNIGSETIVSYTPTITPSLIDGFPGFERITSVYFSNNRFLSVNLLDQFKVDQGIFADSNYFDIFSYSFSKSFPASEFKEPFAVVLSESLAKRLFGQNEAVGQTVTLDKKTELNVIGVYDDLPMNSSIRPEYIVSYPTLERITQIDPWETLTYTFALLEPSVDYKSVEGKIENIFKEYEGREFETVRLNPLQKVRFESVADYYTIIWIFGLIGIFVLAMSAFNYVNLSIANASMRGKEIAIKKMSGSGRFRLIIQFLGESTLLSIVAIAISLYIVHLIIPFYNSIMNTAISLDFYGDWKFVLLLVFSSLLIGLVAGAYPAFFLSSKGIVNLFKKGFFDSGSDRIQVRKALVLMQFAISVFLICLSLLFLRQVNHLTTKDVGLDRHNLLYVQHSSSVEGKYFEDFRAQVLENPYIINASMSQNLPFVNQNGGRINWEGANNEERVHYRPNRVSYSFIDNMGITLIDGRIFSTNYQTDIENACIINETALRYFGWDNPIGKRLDNNKFTVVGVVKDYHIMDIHNPIEPVVLWLAPSQMNGDWVYAFRYMPGHRHEAENYLADVFNRQFPNDNFEIQELDFAFQNEFAFRSYQTVKKSILLFTAFSILLAITGLLGLVSFSTARRTKEIGIRKITGSSIFNIFILLNREFFFLLGISLLVAWPGVWFVYDAIPGVHKLPLNPWVLLLSALLIISITIITTVYQTWRAASRNPIEALRYE